MADVIDIAEMRRKLRPEPKPTPFVESLMETLRNIDAVRAAQEAQSDG